MKTLRYIFLLILGSWLLIPSISAKKPTSRVDQSLSIYNDVMRQLDINYADTLNYEKLTETSINQMLRQLDPYTTYLPEEKTNDLRFMTTGKYGGIGALIMQRNDTTKAGKKITNVYISNPYEGKPAQKADVRAGDKILEVDGKSATGKTTAEVSQMLRGTPGSEITITLQRYGEEKPITRTFAREEIKMNPVDYACLIDEGLLDTGQWTLDSIESSLNVTSPTAQRSSIQQRSGLMSSKIAYISFADFTEGSARIFSDTLDAMVARGAESLIIDLRGNGGGIIDEAVKLLANFVPKGTEVVSTKGRRDGTDYTYRTPFTPKYLDMPIVVLVSGQSASAAEIVAGALQDLDRATIIGTRTFGKGLVQNIRPITGGGHLKVTTAKYYIPSGRCIQAIKYNHDGSAERVADSLTHEFKTKQGRTVRDGGGIEPDIVLSDSSKVNICYPLYVQNMFFDYATRYRTKHVTLPSPETFVVSDSLITDFITFLQEQNFTYKTETSKYFADVLRMAHNEALDSTTIQALEDLQSHLNPSVETAIWNNKIDIQEYLGQEIVGRYYFQKGQTAYILRTDKTLQRAIEELQNQSL